MLSLCVFIPALLFPLQQSTPELDELLRNRIEAAESGLAVIVGDEVVYASTALPLFYERRSYTPAWIDDSNLQQLVAALKSAESEGLRSTDYHLERILSLMASGRSPQRTVDLDLLATDAFLVYGSHLLSGLVNPETIDPEWFANRRGTDLSLILQTAIDNGTIEESLKGLLPPQKGYQWLRDGLRRYRAIRDAGGWKAVAGGPKLESGSTGDRVTALRVRLRATGDLVTETTAEADTFDQELADAVVRFQNRHGLEPDGVVGPSTLRVMNVPVDQRIREIIINLERWRWLPQELGEAHILVNIAGFELDVVEHDETVMTMRVVVGRDYRRTPVFSDRMTYLVLNPTWHVPPSIAVRDKLPEIKKNPGYLAKQRMHLLQGWGADAVEVDPASVDWSTVTAKNFPYRLRQDPGPLNALGRIKFMFPNKFNIYLHDTPTREHFSLAARAFSSGCIRIEKPLDLAVYLLRDNPRWTRGRIQEALSSGQEQTVRLQKPIPVHLLYWTAWTDEAGVVKFREDLYNRDKRLFTAMREEPPSPPDHE